VGYVIFALAGLGTGLATYLSDEVGVLLFVLSVLAFPAAAALLVLGGYQTCKFIIKYAVKFGEGLARVGQRRASPKSGNS
jgi:hypothetical protein